MKESLIVAAIILGILLFITGMFWMGMNKAKVVLLRRNEIASNAGCVKYGDGHDAFLGSRNEGFGGGLLSGGGIRTIIILDTSYAGEASCGNCHYIDWKVVDTE